MSTTSEPSSTATLRKCELCVIGTSPCLSSFPMRIRRPPRRYAKRGLLSGDGTDRTLSKPETTRNTSVVDRHQGFFGNLVLKCDNCSHFRIQLTTCKDDAISALYESMDGIDNLLGSDCGDEAIEDVRRELWMTLLCFVRAIIPYGKLSHLPGREDSSSWENTDQSSQGILVF